MADPANADKFNGSLLIFEAESAAAVRAVVEQDIYWAQNVVRPPLPLHLFFGCLIFVSARWPHLGLCGDAVG